MLEDISIHVLCFNLSHVSSLHFTIILVLGNLLYSKGSKLTIQQTGCLNQWQLILTLTHACIACHEHVTVTCAPAGLKTACASHLAMRYRGFPEAYMQMRQQQSLVPLPFLLFQHT